jgi:hypothetical protein
VKQFALTVGSSVEDGNHTIGFENTPQLQPGSVPAPDGVIGAPLVIYAGRQAEIRPEDQIVCVKD